MPIEDNRPVVSPAIGTKLANQQLNDVIYKNVGGRKVHLSQMGLVVLER